MKTTELIEKLRAYADLFGYVNSVEDFDEDVKDLENLLLASANRLELAYDEICVDCYTCKFSHWNTGHKCKYKDCERAGNENKWQWRGDDE